MKKKMKKPVLRPTSFTPEEVKRMARADEAATKESSGSPAEAFIAPRNEFCGRKLHEPTLDTMIALEAVESPFLGSGKATLISIAEALLVLTTDPCHVEDLVADRPAFQRRAREFSRTIPMAQIAAGGEILTKVLTGAWSTAISSDSEGAKKKTPSVGN